MKKLLLFLLVGVGLGANGCTWLWPDCMTWAHANGYPPDCVYTAGYTDYQGYQSPICVYESANCKGGSQPLTQTDGGPYAGGDSDVVTSNLECRYNNATYHVTRPWPVGMELIDSAGTIRLYVNGPVNSNVVNAAGIRINGVLYNAINLPSKVSRTLAGDDSISLKFTDGYTLTATLHPVTRHTHAQLTQTVGLNPPVSIGIFDMTPCARMTP